MEKLSREDMKDALSEKLERLGLSLVLEKGEARWNTSFLDRNAPHIPIERVLGEKPKALLLKSAQPPDALVCDCASPYEGRRFLYGNASLFLYVHTRDTIVEYLGRHAKDVPDCTPAARLIGFLKRTKGGAKEVVGRLNALGLVDMDSIDDWLSGMLTLSCDPKTLPFFRLNGSHRLHCVGSGELFDLYDGAMVISGLHGMADPKCLPKLIYNAIGGLEKFIALHEITMGGELVYIDRVKEEFSRRFGACEPAAFCGVNWRNGEKPAVPLPGRTGDETLLVHAKDVMRFDPEKELAHLAEKQAHSLNGEIWSWKLMDRKNNIAAVSENICYGDDFTEMKDSILRILSDGQ